MMPAGRYYVGDLCYVMHDRWDEFCDLTISKISGVLDGEFELSDGTRFATYTTLYGDGEYRDGDGRAYGVDAGLIGCILIDDIAESERDNVHSGHVFEFPFPFSTGESMGVISFGHVSIDTGGDTYEEDDAA